MNLDILDSRAEIVFFPVRHHSPSAALLVKRFIERERPAAVLVEGPFDYNPQLDELLLEHQLPIAIYSYFESAEGQRSGAFYPFCVYSPEYQAVKAGRETGSHVEFIDLPWSEMAAYSQRLNRYADSNLGSSRYIQELCRRLEIEDFSELWDRLVEIDFPDFDEYMKRCHQLCYNMRLLDGSSRESLLREEFMAAQISRVRTSVKGRLLVVTGGFHSYALFVRLHQGSIEDANSKVFLESKSAAEIEPDGCDAEDGESCSPDRAEAQEAEEETETEQGEGCPATPTGPQGIALTPYSYERLDSLTGYEAGMPAPGFYHQVFEDRAALGQRPAEMQESDTYRPLLEKTVRYLRKKAQTVSAADLIAVEASAMSLAALRGHGQVWRNDLIDAVLTSIVKDEMSFKMENPFLAAINHSLRGDAIGKLAPGASLPELVKEIEAVLQANQLYPQRFEKVLDFDLEKELDAEKSRLLHKLHSLKIPGFVLQSTPYDDLEFGEAKVVETWTVNWHVGFHAACVEAAIYGSSLDEAAKNKIVEDASSVDSKNAESAALLLLKTCLMGFYVLADEFVDQLLAGIALDSDLERLGSAIRYLLYLGRYDRVLKLKSASAVESALAAAFDRAVWLLDSQTWGEKVGDKVLSVLALLLEVVERTSGESKLNREYFLDTLRRVRVAHSSPPDLRGAACGILWVLDELDPQAVLVDLAYFSYPEKIGDFMNGLIKLSKESVKNRDELLKKLDEMLLNFTVDEFLMALVTLRMAFSSFSPRERFYLSKKILQLAGDTDSHIDVGPTSAEDAPEKMMRLEERIAIVRARFGLSDAT